MSSSGERLNKVTSDPTYRRLCAIIVDPTEADGLTSREWGALGRLSEQQGVAPLLHYCLANSKMSAEVPGEVGQCLRAAFRNTGMANLLLCHELARIVTALKLHTDPPIILLKGAALAETLYPNFGLRPFGDLDLVLPEEALPRSLECLQGLGYREPIPDMAEGVNALIGHHIHLLRTEDASQTCVELHWGLIGGRHDRRSPPMDWFWHQTEALVCPDTSSSVPETLLTLNPTANLLYLCAHLMLQHGEERSPLCWFYDIHLLIEKEGERIDWGVVESRARQFGWAQVIAKGLEAVRQRFQTTVPESSLSQLSRVRRHGPPQLDVLREELLPAPGLSWDARCKFLLATGFPSAAFMRWRYRPRPGWLWPLFYPYRWCNFALASLVTLGRRGRELARLRGQKKRAGRPDRSSG